MQSKRSPRVDFYRGDHRRVKAVQYKDVVIHVTSLLMESIAKYMGAYRRVEKFVGPVKHT